MAFGVPDYVELREHDISLRPSYTIQPVERRRVSNASLKTFHRYHVRRVCGWLVRASALSSGGDVVANALFAVTLRNACRNSGAYSVTIYQHISARGRRRCRKQACAMALAYGRRLAITCHTSAALHLCCRRWPFLHATTARRPYGHLIAAVAVAGYWYICKRRTAFWGGAVDGRDWVQPSLAGPSAATLTWAWWRQNQPGERSMTFYTETDADAWRGVARWRLLARETLPSLAAARSPAYVLPSGGTRLAAEERKTVHISHSVRISLFALPRCCLWALTCSRLVSLGNCRYAFVRTRIVAAILVTLQLA